MKMSFINYNLENKLHKSVVIYKPVSDLHNTNKYNFQVVLKDFNNEKISIVLKRLLFNFIYFFSKNLRNKKKNVKNLLLFLNFYSYYNTFFFNNKIFFYKKYFSKNNFNTFYLKNLFLNKKQIRLQPALHRLKAKRITFFKNHIWNKNRKFRKKNILIFNKKFFKRYNLTRFNDFVVDSLLHYSGVKKIKFLRVLKKKFSSLLNRKYYYLFLYKRYIFSRPKKRFKKKKIISYNFRYKTYAKIFVNRKFFAYRRRKKWRQVYYVRKRKFISNRLLFLGFDTKCMNAFIFRKFKEKKKNYSLYFFSDYLITYSAKLAKKYASDKNFTENFFLRKNFRKRYRNILYYFRWKPKLLNFHFFNFFKKDKNLKKNIFSAVFFKFFQRKIFWKKRKFLRAFFLLYYNNFFLNKFFLFFNFFFRPKFSFVKINKWRKRKRIKRRRFMKYIKRLRRRIIKKRIKRKFVRFFLILLFFRLMKKHKNVHKILLLKNSFFLSKIKSIKLNLLTSLLLGTDSFYFKNNNFLEYSVVNFKENLKIISLLQKNKV